MGVMAVCGLMLLAGVAMAVVWGGRPFETPPTDVDLSAGEVARRFAWYVALVLTGGVTAGLLVIGAGGRLAMRLLAVTAGDSAQGAITEADEVVGRITAGGTFFFIVFNGIFGGVVTGAMYLLIRRFLPPGRLGGAVFGLILLVLFGTTIDPLREENPDFDLLGQGWLAVIVFTILAVVFGLTMRAVMARLSTGLPQLAATPRVLVRWIAPAVIAAVTFSVTFVTVGVGLVVVLVTRWRPVVRAVRSDRWVIVGRVVLILVALAALPGAVTSVAHIVT